MGRKRGSRFRKAIDAQEQVDSIRQAQRRRREKQQGTLIERIDKSEQREANAFSKLRRVDEVKDEFS